LVSVFFSRAKIGSTIGGLLLLALLAPAFAIKQSTPPSSLAAASLSPVVEFFFDYVYGIQL
jgi:ABC-type proline/glycine betaine transport system permease subunit